MTRAGVLALFLLAGCATSTPISNDGKHLIECDGSAIPWSVCFKKANKVCPKGYDVLERSTEHGPITGTATSDIAVLGSAERKNLVVKCH